MTSIGTLQESSLHAALKDWYKKPGDRLEVDVDGYVIDIYRDDLLIEIQTGNFTALKKKLPQLLKQYTVHLVYPVAQEKWIVRVAADGQTAISRRKSPKRGCVYHLFRELVRLPTLLDQPNFSIEVALIQLEEIWCDDGRGSWRRKRWSITDRRLLKVVEQITLTSPQALSALLPATLAPSFTTLDLSRAVGQSRAVAQQMVYCLRKMALIEIVGKQGNSLLYSRGNHDAL